MAAYADIALTPSVLSLQDQKGSRGFSLTPSGEGSNELHRLDDSELEMLTTRDSFYLASVSESGWPYVQHRGGEQGFIKVLGEHTIGWVERNGNRQYLGTGNIAANGRVAAILVDYPTRSRLKLYGNATYHADPSPELLASLDAEGVRHDGAITIDVLATNWNCPKYITPRFTQDEVTAATAPLRQRVAELEAQVADNAAL
jgi:predicted pyridoxine 5'-phosphate oxidase superfamily flavin-nucleotide-binding protein